MASTAPDERDGDGGNQTPDDKAKALENSLKVTVRTRPDGLRRISYAGQLKGPGAQAFVRDQFLPGLLGKYPRAKWVVAQQDITGDAADTFVEFSAELAELIQPLPAAPGAAAVEGEATFRVDRDEQMRLVNTT